MFLKSRKYHSSILSRPYIRCVMVSLLVSTFNSFWVEAARAEVSVSGSRERVVSTDIDNANEFQIGTVYQGFIGSGSSIKFLATANLETDDDGQPSKMPNQAINGTIHYDSTGRDGLIIEGNMMPQLSWKESVYDNTTSDFKVTGYYTGQYFGSSQGISNQGSQEVRGEWQSADHKKKESLTMRPLAHRYTFQSTTPTESVAASYVQLLPGSLDSSVAVDVFNKAMRQKAIMTYFNDRDNLRQIQEEARKSKEDGDSAFPDESTYLYATDCNLEHLDRQTNIVSIVCQQETYTGGAHGMTYYSTFVYNLSDLNQVRRIGLWDILKKTPQNIKDLNHKIVADLKKQGATGDEIDLIDSLQDGSIKFVVIPAGIAFLFDPYEVGSYAEGQYRAVVYNDWLKKALK